MAVRVVVPPDPIVTPADVAGGHAADDPAVVALIQAVTEGIDGPDGWLGRALGKQTLELTLPSFCGRNLGLPYPPVIADTATVKYLDLTGVEQTVDPSNYKVIDNRIWLDSGFSFPAVRDAPDAVRIRYDAGYNGAGEGKTGAVPERARQAIILSVQDLIRAGAATPGLRSETVEGVGAQTFLDADKVTAIVERTCNRLLSTLRIYTL
ncbi:MAG: hypothetical protein WA973_18125 [Mesorhizobium sp.]|jgi:hypothetical protein